MIIAPNNYLLVIVDFGVLLSSEGKASKYILKTEIENAEPAVKKAASVDVINTIQSKPIKALFLETLVVLPIFISLNFLNKK